MGNGGGQSPCACACAVLIDGPADLGLCQCEDLHFVLDPSGPYAILRAWRADGALEFERLYHATLTPTCTAAQPGRTRYTWTMAPVASGGVVLGVTAHMDYICTGKGEGRTTGRRTECTAPPFTVGVHRAPCIISVISVQVPFYDFGHIAIQITCGEFCNIYGFYATDQHVSTTLVGTPGEVHIFSSSGTFDGIGTDYANFYPAYAKKIWTIDVSCEICSRVRRYWERVTANPGTYSLLSRTCATVAMKCLEDCGLVVWSDAEDYEDTEILPSSVETVMDGIAGQDIRSADGSTSHVSGATTVPGR